MALIKELTLDNGITCENAYHVIVGVTTTKRPVDDPDPGGLRHDDTPEHLWRAGYWGRITVAIYASKAARDAGKTPIAAVAKYPTDMPYGFLGAIETTDEMIFEIDPTSEISIVNQAYAYLATLPRYADATSE
jgi:hypothetical protein